MEELKRVHVFLIDFVVNNRTATCEEVKPSTMKGYFLGIQRFFTYDWGYELEILEGPVFACP